MDSECLTFVFRIVFRIETSDSPLYNFNETPLSQDDSNSPVPPKPRRWSIFAASLLVLALGLVVIYTSRPAFSSPLALVVVAAIGLAALLMQLRLRKDLRSSIHAPLWLNVLGLLLALAAVFADHLQLSPNLMIIAALGAVICFGVSGTVVLHALRKRKS